jgi:hypothetical protein
MSHNPQQSRNIRSGRRIFSEHPYFIRNNLDNYPIYHSNRINNRRVRFSSSNQIYSDVSCLNCILIIKFNYIKLFKCRVTFNILEHHRICIVKKINKTYGVQNHHQGREATGPFFHRA